MWTGDLDGMIAGRSIRVLVPYSRTLYFNDKGRERGVTVDIFRQFERYINQKYKKELGKRPITVYLAIPYLPSALCFISYLLWDTASIMYRQHGACLH